MHEHLRFFSPPPPGTPLTLWCSGWSYCDGTYRIRRPSPGDLFVFEFVKHGRGTLKSGDAVCFPQAGDCYLAPGHLPHEYFSSADDPWTKCWINVRGPLPGELVTLYGLTGHILFPQALEAGHFLQETVNDLLDVPEQEAQEFAALRIHQLIQLLVRALRPQAQCLSPAEEAAVLLHDELQKIVAGPLPDLQELCRRQGFSQLQLTRCFRKRYGTTPYAFLLDRKMSAAAELLGTTGVTIKELARLLGFQDEYYFARLFRQRQGISPGRFRRQKLTNF